MPREAAEVVAVAKKATFAYRGIPRRTEPISSLIIVQDPITPKGIIFLQREMSILIRVKRALSHLTDKSTQSTGTFGGATCLDGNLHMEVDMNQPTHAWLAVEAYRKIVAEAKTDDGKRKKLDGLARLLGAHLGDVVVAAWLPDSLIKDMSYGHVFKNSLVKKDETGRFRITKDDLTAHLPAGAQIPKVAFDHVDATWWDKSYKVKDNGGHLPARINALCQTARDMFRMGDADVVELTEIKSRGAEKIANALLYSPRNVAMTLWMTSHYIADAHMPFHCDNRAVASTARQTTHCDVENLWGEQVSDLFHAKTLLGKHPEEILNTRHPEKSAFDNLDFGKGISALKNSGDPWKEAVYICRASFAASFAMVPMEISPVDDKSTAVSLKDILNNNNICGEDRFWEISRAIVVDAVNSIAMFWQDTWVDFTNK